MALRFDRDCVVVGSNPCARFGNGENDEKVHLINQIIFTYFVTADLFDWFGFNPPSTSVSNSA